MAGKILYVEDEAFLGKTMATMLEKAGYSVTVAPDGEEGLNAVKREKTDLVLLDLLLPKIDGFEVLRRIKEDPLTKDIPVIVLSNLGAKEDEERTKKLGARAHFVKALVDPRKLVQHVHSLLGTGAQ